MQKTADYYYFFAKGGFASSGKNTEPTEKVIKAFYKMYNTFGHGLLDKVDKKCFIVK